uniref:Putative cuticle protein CPH43 n=1 Tax=Pararge aegeria TaxID=116150 RepID=S4NSE1_9NEOP
MGLLVALAVNVIGGAAIYLTGGLATGIVAPLLGFGNAGIGAGTLAASAQAYYGNVAAGSIISQLTAAAMVAPTP